MTKPTIRNFGVLAIREEGTVKTEGAHVSATPGHGLVHLSLSNYPSVLSHGLTVERNAFLSLNVAQTEDLIGMLQDAIRVARGEAQS